MRGIALHTYTVLQTSRSAPAPPLQPRDCTRTTGAGPSCEVLMDLRARSYSRSIEQVKVLPSSWYHADGPVRGEQPTVTDMEHPPSST